MNSQYNSNYQKSISQIKYIDNQIQKLYMEKRNFQLYKAQISMFWKANESKNINQAFDSIINTIQLSIQELNVLKEKIKQISESTKDEEYNKYIEEQKIL